MLEIFEPNKDDAVDAFAQSARSLTDVYRRYIFDPAECESLYLITCNGTPLLFSCVFRCGELAGIDFCELAIFDASSRKQAFMKLFDCLKLQGIRDITCTAKVTSRRMRTAELVGFEDCEHSSVEDERNIVCFYQALEV